MDRDRIEALKSAINKGMEPSNILKTVADIPDLWLAHSKVNQKTKDGRDVVFASLSYKEKFLGDVTGCLLICVSDLDNIPHSVRVDTKPPFFKITILDYLEENGALEDGWCEFLKRYHNSKNKGLHNE